MRSDIPPSNAGKLNLAPPCEEPGNTSCEHPVNATPYCEDTIAAAEKLADAGSNAELAAPTSAPEADASLAERVTKVAKLYAVPNCTSGKATGDANKFDDSSNDCGSSDTANTRADQATSLHADGAGTNVATIERPESSEAEQPSNVVNLFTGQTVDDYATAAIIRVCGEINGARMLYSTLERPERLVAVPILCWALLEDGSVTGMVPWLDEVLPCEAIEHNYSINWEGYYCSIAEDFFGDPPAEVIAQLSVAARFNSSVLGSTNRTMGGSAATLAEQENWHIVQEIPDPIGTHALLLNETSDALILTSVISWTLDEYGRLHGMLADDACIEKLPVLPGDDCLFCAEDESSFKCFFQRDIAEQIRTQNPETMEAIEQLFGN